ncbi:MAG: hypothetical protein JO033_27055 [Acidobacteriaceae bacterium]|nr:hypothetical protein [Acidobacteriaceae bacterium]MBV9502656.1 hypothetical protein [Acidobacteriaceae bacterium]
MSKKIKGQPSSQPDKDLAAEERPKPSQAEGDLETVEEDLEQTAKTKPTDAQKS